MFQKIKTHLSTLMMSLACVALIALSGYTVSNELKNAAPVHALTVQSVKTFSGSITTEATVCTGAASTALHVYSMDISSSVAGVVVFKDGTGGATILNVYCAANTPRNLTEIFGQDGLTLSQNVLTATLASSTLTASFRISNQPL